MKLATQKSGGRDGRLLVVTSDLRRAAPATRVSPTLQHALDTWEEARPRLEALGKELESGQLEGAFDLRTEDLHAPLPRAYQWVDGSAYLNHVQLVRKARGAEMPESFWTDPLMYQGASDCFIGPNDPVVAATEDWGIDFEGEVCVITGDVPMGTTPAEAAKKILLVMLVNDVSLRNLIPNELAKGFGFLQSKPASSFSPVAVTPDALGDAWKDGRLHLPLVVHLNGELFGKPEAGPHMIFDFGQLVAHAAKTRPLAAGSVVGSGTVSNPGADDGPGKPVADGGIGYSCLAEVRVVETILHGKPKTPFMRFGDRVRIEMFDRAGKSIFGAIDQQVVRG